MPSSSSPKPKTIALLVESSCGVTEYLVGVQKVDETAVISAVAARVASGKGSSLSRETLQEAITLHHWALTHPDVFTEGRVGRR
jgi:hypothetical protein